MTGMGIPGGTGGVAGDGEALEARDRRLRGRIGELTTEYLARGGQHTVAVADEERIVGFCRAVVEEEVRRGRNNGAPPIEDPEALIVGLRDWQLGLGPLEPLLRDPAVTEIMVNGPGRVVVERHGQTAYTPIRFHDDDELRALITRLADRDNRPFNRANPTVELQLADGSRLHAVTAPIVEGTTVTIRKFKPIYSDLDTLVAERGMLPPMAGDFLAAAIHCGANVLIAGETNSGKCVAPDTPIVLGDGRRAALGPLVDAALADPAAVRIVGEAGWEGVRFPHPVWTVDPATGMARIGTAAVAWRHPAPPTLVAVTLETGETLTVTAEHPFLLAGAGPTRFVPAGALAVGQRVAVAPPPASSAPDDHRSATGVRAAMPRGPAGRGLLRSTTGRGGRRHHGMAPASVAAAARFPAACGVRVAGLARVPAPAPAVYDLTVPGTATYCLGHVGVVTHNTTLLTALILAACTINPASDPTGERIVVIETARELQLQRGRLSHVISLQVVEQARGDGARAFSERDLVYQALRMNPRRLILGEVRNEAAFELLDGLNTGHRGSAATIHANTPADTLIRLATLAERAPNAPARGVIMQMIANTINLVVQVERIPNSERRVVTAIAEVAPRVADGAVPLNDLWVWDEDTDRLLPTAAMLSSRWLPRIRRYRLPLQHLDEAILARQIADVARGTR